MAAGAESLADNHATRELKAYSPVELPAAKLLAHAAKASGRGVFEITREHRRLKKGRGQLSLREYVTYGLYDSARYASEEQSRFIGSSRHWPITHLCCDMTWQATTEDKWLCERILRGSGVPMPETLAVIDASMRNWPGTRVLATAEELRDYFMNEVERAVFGKVNRGIVSAGAFLAEGADENGLYLKGEGHVAYGAFLDEFAGSNAYLVQPVIRQHHYFDRYTDTLPTVRVCVLVAEDGVRVPFSVLKLPGQGNIADSFWRPGNIACALDPETGRILSARTRDGIQLEDHQLHPETGATFAAEVLPFWSELRDLVEETALIFAPVRYQSMDIAITEDGPLLIEINTGGGFDLPQYATGEGFLTDEVRDFFLSCGVKDI